MTTAFKSTTFGASICLRLKARSCRVREVARSAALAISCAGARSGESAACLLQQEFGISRDHHQQIVEVVRDPSRESAHGFHLLGLAELQFQNVALGHVLGKQFVENLVAFIAQSPAGEAHYDRPAIFAHPLRHQSVELLHRTKAVRQREPLLRIGIEACQVQTHEFVSRAKIQHGDQSRIHVEQTARPNRSGILRKAR